MSQCLAVEFKTFVIGHLIREIFCSPGCPEIILNCRKLLLHSLKRLNLILCSEEENSFLIAN